MASTNWALQANGGVASASSELIGGGQTWLAVNANDGTRVGTGGVFTNFGWASSTGVGPHWWQCDFSGSKTIDAIYIFCIQDGIQFGGGTSTPTDLMTGSAFVETGLNVQYWNGASWVTIATLASDFYIWKRIHFSPITTTKIRVNLTDNGNGDGYARLCEVEAWESDPATLTVRTTQAGLLVQDSDPDLSVRVSQAGVLVQDSDANLPVQVSQAGLLVMIGVPIEVRVSQAGLLVMLSDAPDPPCPTPSEGEDLCDAVDDVVLFGQWQPGGGTVVRYAETDLPDPSGYYGGLKEGRLVSLSEVSRKLSDTLWRYDISHFTVALADDDFNLRSILCQEPGKYFTSRDMDLWAITSLGRELGVDAKTVAAGIVDSDPVYDNTDTGVIVSLTCRDRIGAKFSWTLDGQAKLPRRIITSETLPGAPLSLINKAPMFPYGRLGSTVLSSGTAGVVLYPAPVITGSVQGPGGTGQYKYAITAIYNVPGSPVQGNFADRNNHVGESGPSNFYLPTNGPTSDSDFSRTNYIAIRWPLLPPNINGVPVKAYRAYGRYIGYQELSLLDAADPGVYHDGELNGRDEFDLLKTTSHPPEPIITGIGLDAPTWSAGPTGYCGSLSGAEGRSGWTPLTTPQLGTVTASVLAGGALSLLVPSAQYYVQVFPVGATGRVYDPYPRCDDALVATVTPGNQTIQATWGLHPDAVEYWVYLGYSAAGVQWTQRLVVTGLSATFTAQPDPGTPATDSNVTPGATALNDARFYYYRVRAKNGSQRGPWSAVEAFGITRTRFPEGVPGMRTYRLWWNPTGAPEYELQRRTATSTWEYQWLIDGQQLQDGLPYYDETLLLTAALPISSVTSKLMGKVKPLYAGLELINSQYRHRWMIAGCAIKGVTAWYYDPEASNETSAVELSQGHGTDWWMPGVSGYEALSATPYRDVVGGDGITRRYAMAYGFGAKADIAASGSGNLTLDLNGIEDVGDGSGEVIVSLFDQFEHMAYNLILASGVEAYRTGNWINDLTMGPASICAIDGNTLDAVKAQREEEFGGPIDGAGIVGAFGERVSITEELARWQTCGDFRLGTNRHWQLRGMAIDRSRDLGSAPRIRDTTDVHARSFKVESRLSEMFNRFTYRYGRSFAVDNQWDIDNLIYVNETSVERWQSIHDLDLSFHYLADPYAVTFVLGEIVRRTEDVPNYITVEGPLCWMGADYDIGEYALLDHWRGLGPNGYRTASMLILENSFLPSVRRVRLTLQDVTSLLPTPSGVGWVWAPASSTLTYADASPEERATYMFWANSAGQNPDGTPGQKWN